MNDAAHADLTTKRVQISKNDIEALRSFIGDDFGEWGPHVQVPQKKINDFAEVTGDRQWVHVDPTRAAQGPYKAPIAHGFLTLSLLLDLRLPPPYEINDVQGIIHAGGSYDFKRPVFVGNHLYARERLVGVECIRGRKQLMTQLTIAYEIAVVEMEKVAVVGTIKLVYL